VLLVKSLDLNQDPCQAREWQSFDFAQRTKWLENHQVKIRQLFRTDSPNNSSDSENKSSNLSQIVQLANSIFYHCTHTKIEMISTAPGKSQIIKTGNDHWLQLESGAILSNI
jgi:hypothetical protein